MNRRERSLKRLDELADYYRDTGQVKAVLAFGSCGKELDRFDEYSDLDFLVVCEDAHQQTLLQNLCDVERIAPVEFYSIHYGDAVKLLFKDDVFCDYGIVRESQLPFILHVEGRVLWRRPGFDVQLCKSNLSPVTQTASHILLDELLCALYIGLYREKRGERVAAFRSIQVEAVEYLLKLEGADKAAQTSGEDCFSASRRAEQRLPNIKALLPTVMQGYSGNVESAKAVIGFIMQRYPVNLPFAQRILAMCQ